MPVVILPIRLIYGFRSRIVCVCVLSEKSDAQANLTVKIDILLGNARARSRRLITILLSLPVSFCFVISF